MRNLLYITFASVCLFLVGCGKPQPGRSDAQQPTSADQGENVESSGTSPRAEGSHQPHPQPERTTDTVDAYPEPLPQPQDPMESWEPDWESLDWRLGADPKLEHLRTANHIVLRVRVEGKPFFRRKMGKQLWGAGKEMLDLASVNLVPVQAKEEDVVLDISCEGEFLYAQYYGVGKMATGIRFEGVVEFRYPGATSVRRTFTGFKQPPELIAGAGRPVCEHNVLDDDNGLYKALVDTMREVYGAAPLVEALGRGNQRYHTFRPAAERTLTQLGPPALPLILTLVVYDDSDVVSRWVEVLVGMGDPAIPVLQKLRDDDMYNVRRGAQRGLAKLGKRQ